MNDHDPSSENKETSKSDTNATASLFPFEMSVPGRDVCYSGGLCDSLVSQHPVLPDIKQIGTQTQRAAAMEFRKQTGPTEIVIDSTRPKKDA